MLKPCEITLGAERDLIVEIFDTLNIIEFSHAQDITSFFWMSYGDFLDGIHCLVAAMIDCSFNINLSIRINIELSVVLSVLDKETQLLMGFTVLNAHLANVVG